uniref:Uncharacterized protein n=1 Tax=Chromera velia CCMP2878 TaxID=1169474 RepID=A0A0G4I9Y3_9ALVE|eukprot:Cvel_2053.t1-p1 / transcript=Cvel_2053.t1 / gene=Cvel_2053 / organism=Chromera_velia_CCMP2878 / gene_product=hypothetical protein / transcript_product=hypothetical protein / location=Cvel_scaffold79:8583-12884(-) / protein_length=245 / sequence_SO=supercontig / SO=protein_coding / is_pseudo=false
MDDLESPEKLIRRFLSHRKKTGKFEDRLPPGNAERYGLFRKLILCERNTLMAFLKIHKVNLVNSDTERKIFGEMTKWEREEAMVLEPVTRGSGLETLQHSERRDRSRSRSCLRVRRTVRGHLAPPTRSDIEWFRRAADYGVYNRLPPHLRKYFQQGLGTEYLVRMRNVPRDADENEIRKELRDAEERAQLELLLLTVSLPTNPPQKSKFVELGEVDIWNKSGSSNGADLGCGLREEQQVSRGPNF